MKTISYLVQGSATNPRGLASYSKKWTTSTPFFSSAGTWSSSRCTRRMALLNPSVHNSILSTGSYAKLSTVSLLFSARYNQFQCYKCDNNNLNLDIRWITFNDILYRTARCIIKADAEYVSVKMTNVGEKEFPCCVIVSESRKLGRVVRIQRQCFIFAPLFEKL